MKKESAAIFQKLSKVDKKILFQNLIAEKTEVLAKGEEEKIFYMIVREITHPHVVECELVSASDRPRIHQEVMLSIESKTDRYYAMTRLTIDENRYNLDISGDIFILQRRKSARLSLPESMRQNANIIAVDGKVVFVPARVENFGVGGMKLLVPQLEPAFNVGVNFEIVMQLDRKSLLTLKCVVRHSELVHEEDQSAQCIGVQFVEQDHKLIRKMTMMFLDLQREVFLKCKIF